MALGEEDAPTDLALSLDYRVQHLLIDEFQDTSHSQWQLLRKLVAGWQHGDGRTLFLVGDPMQSIYRFRKAEVALFLHAQQHGIRADLPLTPLTLTRNFRSQQAIVAAINDTFNTVFPRHADAQYSAVPYVAAEATKSRLDGAAVHCCLWLSENGDDDGSRTEAQHVVTLCQRALTESDGEVAIFVRARSHLQAIIPALQQANLSFSAVDIASLSDAPHISDLQQLTRALAHLADRLAWLTVLRAPWCGLTAQALHQLCGATHHLTVFEQLQRADFAQLDPDNRARIERIWPVLQNAVAQHDVLPLAMRVEACWRGLSADHLLQNDNERADAEQFFEKLYGLKTVDVDLALELDQITRQLYAQTDNQARIKLMTMHKAKGLEFDTVIVPGLHKTLPADSGGLLAWEDPIDPDQGNLLIGPYEHRADRATGMASYLRMREKVRADEEIKRLLYVCATRAKNRLFWLATLNKKDPIKPQKGSALYYLWPALAAEFLNNAQSLPATTATADTATVVPLLRYARNWQAPTLTTPTSSDSANLTSSTAVNRAGIRVRAIGTVTHAWLEQLSRQDLPPDAQQFVDEIAHRVRKQLLWQGINNDDLRGDAEHVLRAIHNVLSDPTGRWLLQQNHDARSEWALTQHEDNGFSHHIIDRCFVDEHGTRWIVDYKTAIDDGGDWPAFLTRKITEYRPQLQRYATLLSQLEQRPQKLALYFPLQQQLVEI
jgi:ATP-dependent exoDNAse (exonuclease V) beta subunit